MLQLPRSEQVRTPTEKVESLQHPQTLKKVENLRHTPLPIVFN